MVERRQWPRYRVECPVQVQVIVPSGPPAVEYGRLQNISAGGALGNIGHGVSVGARVEVVVQLTLLKPVIMKFTGEVARAEPAAAGFDVAVKFYDSEPIFLNEWPQA